MTAPSLTLNSSIGRPADERPAGDDARLRPIFSVVAPVYNERETIAAFYARARPLYIVSEVVEAVPMAGAAMSSFPRAPGPADSALRMYTGRGGEAICR